MRSKTPGVVICVLAFPSRRSATDRRSGRKGVSTWGKSGHFYARGRARDADERLRLVAKGGSEVQVEGHGLLSGGIRGRPKEQRQEVQEQKVQGEEGQWQEGQGQEGQEGQEEHEEVTHGREGSPCTDAPSGSNSRTIGHEALGPTGPACPSQGRAVTTPVAIDNSPPATVRIDPPSVSGGSNRVFSFVD